MTGNFLAGPGVKMYSVKYKKSGSLFWSKLSNLKAEGIIKNDNGVFFPYRFFVTEKEEWIEVPMKDMIFKFDTNRFLAKKRTMELEAGHQITLDTKIK